MPELIEGDAFETIVPLATNMTEKVADKLTDKVADKITDNNILLFAYCP